MMSARMTERPVSWATDDDHKSIVPCVVCDSTRFTLMHLRCRIRRSIYAPFMPSPYERREGFWDGWRLRAAYIVTLWMKPNTQCSIQCCPQNPYRMRRLLLLLYTRKRPRFGLCYRCYRRVRVLGLGNSSVRAVVVLVSVCAADNAMGI